MPQHTILVIDDEPKMCKALKFALEKLIASNRFCSIFIGKEVEDSL